MFCCGTSLQKILEVASNQDWNPVTSYANELSRLGWQSLKTGLILDNIVNNVHQNE